MVVGSEVVRRTMPESLQGDASCSEPRKTTKRLSGMMCSDARDLVCPPGVAEREEGAIVEASQPYAGDMGDGSLHAQCLGGTHVSGGLIVRSVYPTRGSGEMIGEMNAVQVLCMQDMYARRRRLRRFHARLVPGGNAAT